MLPHRAFARVAENPFAMPAARPRIGDPLSAEISLAGALAGLGGTTLALAIAGVLLGSLLLG